MNHLLKLPTLMFLTFLVTSCTTAPTDVQEEQVEAAVLSSFYDTGTLKEYCAKVGVVTHFQDAGALQQAGFCVGYVAGVIDHEAVSVLTGVKKPSFCVPSDIKVIALVEQINRVFEMSELTTGTASHWLTQVLQRLFPPENGVCPLIKSENSEASS